MPGRTREEIWDRRIWELTKQMGKGPGPVRARIVEELKKRGRLEDEAPSERTIARRQKFFRDQSPEWQRQFDFFRFPESLEFDLPPEAARSAFELWRRLGHRPAVRTCRAFHLVTLAVGEAVDTRIRFALAVRILAAEDDPDQLRQIDDAIAREDWSQAYFPAIVGNDHDAERMVTEMELQTGQLENRDWWLRLARGEDVGIKFQPASPEGDTIQL